MANNPFATKQPIDIRPEPKYWATLEVFLTRDNPNMLKPAHYTARVMQWEGDRPVFGENLLPARAMTDLDARGLVRAKLQAFARDVVFITEAPLP